MTPGTVVIVGAGLAGSRCAETLRAEGFGALLHFGCFAGDTAGRPLSHYGFVNGGLGAIGRKCGILRASGFFSTLLKSGILKCWHLVVGTF